VVVIDEAHAFFHERKGTSPEVKAQNALVAELSRLVEEQIRNVATSPSKSSCSPSGPPGMPSRPASGTTARSPSASPPAPRTARWRRWGRRSATTPMPPRVLLNDPAYVGVAVTSLPGRAGFHRVRTPQVDHHQVAAIIRATTGLRADLAALLAEQAPGLRVVSPMPAPGDAA
jgi:S-DNA-T family DNA segregation ATPase FtsK/SpoIIIE